MGAWGGGLVVAVVMTISVIILVAMVVLGGVAIYLVGCSIVGHGQVWW